MEEVVTLQLEAPLALVTLNRPKSLNALNSEVYRQLIAILRQVEGMDAIKAVILTGAGDKAFAAGADIAQMVHEDSMAAQTPVRAVSRGGGAAGKHAPGDHCRR